MRTIELNIDKEQSINSVETAQTVITEEPEKRKSLLPNKPTEEQYEFAVSFMKIGDYETAEFALREFIDNSSAYTFYEIKNGERPDTVSQRLYGTPDFYWTFFVINEFLHDGYKVWPLSQEQLFDYIKEANGSFILMVLD